MNFGKSIIAMMTAASAAVCGMSVVSFADEASKSDDIVILYTNDIHCGADKNIGYDGLALYKREMQAQYEHVLLVDAGDFLQGEPLGTLSDGAYITRMMNAVGYDVVTVGNHDFDYGMDELMLREDELSCGAVCANVYNSETSELLFDPYKIITAGDMKIAFVGVCTPETLIKSTPVFFQNDKGEYIYSFGEDGDIYELVQRAVDSAREEGADLVILLAHLGENGVTEGWSSPEVAAQLTGIDAIIDGHSHEITPELAAKTKDGKNIIITQTGTKLENIGKMTITADGKITTELIDSVPAPDEASGIAEDSWLEPDGREGRFVDEAVNREILLIQDEYGDTLGKKIGTSEYDLLDIDPVTEQRLVRNSETNIGDLCADCYKEVLGTDIGMVNGGGIRTSIQKGDITYYEVMSVFPFNNLACTAEVTGQQILDVLEVGAMKYPEEAGSFINISGGEYTIDASVPSSVVLNEKGEFIAVEGEYRVKNVIIGGEPLDTAKTYTVATHNYYLKEGGDGYIFSGKCKLLIDSIMTDFDVLAEYIRDNLGGVIPEEYSDPHGQGRIKFLTAADVSDDTDEEPASDEEPDAEDEADTAENNVPQDIGAPAEDTAPEVSENPSTGADDTAAVVVCFASLAALALSVKRKYRK